MIYSLSVLTVFYFIIHKNILKFRKMLFCNCNYCNFVCFFYLLQPKQAAMRDEVEILKKLHHVIIIFSLLLFSLKPLNSTFNFAM